jgi:hypothetical protein
MLVMLTSAKPRPTSLPSEASPARSRAFNSKPSIRPYAIETRGVYCPSGRLIGERNVEPMSRPAGRDRRKNFRLGWHLPATIYDAGRPQPSSQSLSLVSTIGAKGALRNEIGK